MRITDINCMIGAWPERRKIYKDIEDLFVDMDNYRLSGCVAFHSMSLWSPERGNSLIKQMSDKSLGRVKPCYVLGAEPGQLRNALRGRALYEAEGRKTGGSQVIP